jgi:hypothetical protein
MHIRRTILVSLGVLLAADAAADMLRVDCIGEESAFTETFKENQQNLVHRPRTIRFIRRSITPVDKAVTGESRA